MSCLYSPFNINNISQWILQQKKERKQWNSWSSYFSPLQLHSTVCIHVCTVYLFLKRTFKKECCTSFSLANSVMAEERIIRRRISENLQVFLSCLLHFNRIKFNCVMSRVWTENAGYMRRIARQPGRVFMFFHIWRPFFLAAFENIRRHERNYLAVLHFIWAFFKCLQSLWTFPKRVFNTFYSSCC